MNGTRGERRGGFSLPELMIVLLIGGMIAALSYPEMSRMLRKSRTVESADRFEAMLRLAREKALTKRVNYRLTLNAASKNYVVEFEQTPGTWVADFDSPIALSPGIGFTVSLNGGTGGADMLVEPRGTLSFADAPAEVVFFNDRGDSIQVEMVRTGRVRSWSR